MVQTTGLAYITILVTDVERSRTFYRDVLGLAEVHTSEHFVLLSTGNSQLGLHTGVVGAKVVGAQADGSWTALDGVENLEIPPDLDDAFSEYGHARENFEAFPRSVKRGILEWIHNAKREATRAKRVEETVRLADENIRANQWRTSKAER